MDWTQILISAFGLIGTVIGGVSYYSRQRSKLDLIRELNKELADKTRLIRKLNDEVITLTREKYENEQCYLSSRCFKTACDFRHPKLPWRKEAVSNPHALPKSDPQPDFAETSVSEVSVTVIN